MKSKGMLTHFVYLLYNNIYYKTIDLRNILKIVFNNYFFIYYI